MTHSVGRALVEEATKKSGVVWIAVGGAPPRAAWHVWHEGALHLVVGGLEQQFPELATATQARVTVPSKDKGGRLVTWRAVPRLLAPGTDEWESAANALHAERLNPPDGEAQPQRWARESQIWRLEPTGQIVEQPGSMPDDSGAAPPPPTSATTRGPLPYVFRRRPGPARDSPAPPPP